MKQEKNFLKIARKYSLYAHNREAFLAIVNMRNIFFDLDGTLIDSKPRLYKLFCDLLPHIGLSFEAYWELKRSQVGHEKIISDFKDSAKLTVEEFQGKWMQRIERKEYLELDTPFPGINEMFDRLKKNGNKIIFVTSRQSPESAGWQINKWGWQEYLTDIIVTKQNAEKGDLIKRRFTELGSSDIIVGDTGMDIQTGHELGIISIAVLSGFRNRESILKYRPDYVFDLVTEIDFETIK